MHIFFFNLIYYLFFIPPYHPPVWMTHTHTVALVCVCVCCRSMTTGFLPSLYFFPIRLFFYLTFIFIYSLFFSTQFALLTFLFGLRLWEHDILELRNVSTSSFLFCFMRLCFMCHLLVPVSFYFIFHTEICRYYFLLLNSMELASGLVFPCLPVLLFLNSSFKLWLI